ncbi:hypothetical protein [Arthrobacter ramosus]|uniref:hypothetical protein n=1 Tax=Arthrobacter ramosus TaxID=1672 RepID=UPI001F370578|nr:hypothetical protein [Arthrobacter ramosus]
MVRPVLLAVFGALAWLLWLAGPSQATDLLPTIPAVPTPSVSLPPVPLTDPVGPIVDHVPSVVPSPGPLATVPKTVVNQLTEQVLTPVVGVVDAVPPVVENTIGELPPLPEPPSVPALPPVPGVLPPHGPSVPAIPVDPLRAGSVAALTAPTILASTSPRTLVVLPPEMLATAEMSPVPGGAPPARQVPPAAPSQESGSTSESQGGSAAYGAADLPEQRALAPPPRHGPIPDRRQSPSAEPAFDPGSSPD